MFAGGGGGSTNGTRGSPCGVGGGGFRTNVPGQTSGGGASAESATGVFVSPGTIQVEVGSGGTGANPGNPSWFGPGSSNKLIESIGGGHGAKYNGSAGPGGSGGGGRKPGGAGGSGTSGQGYDGANSPGSAGGGGGGGAGAAGSAHQGGDGQRATWVPGSYGTAGPQPGRYFAGGGSGHNGPNALPGGAGGGGDFPSGAGGTNTGGGGAANMNQGNDIAGGSGIVILRYAQ